MISKPLGEIQLADLHGLLGDVREGKTIEYKQAMPAKTDKEVIQFLAAVSAFANTAGGDLLIGVSSVDGVACALPGIPLNGFDGEKLRLEQLLADNIEPRLPPVAFHSVECGNGQHVVIIRIPRSWLAPHRVNKNNVFYGRNSAGKYPLDVGELRDAFVLRESVAERIREFRQKRLLKITSGDTPAPLAPSTSMVLHVVPVPSFGDRRLINVVEALRARPIPMPVPPGSQGVGDGVNLDGAFVWSGPSFDQCHGYGLLFRDGSIEGVKQLSIQDGRPYLAGAVFEREIVAALGLYMRTCQQLEAGLPVYVGLSFCNAKGCKLKFVEGGLWALTQRTFKDDVIALPELLIESDSVDLPRVLKPVFDMVWNAFGHIGSSNYNAAGKWIGSV
jgi:hypothetical protein